MAKNITTPELLISEIDEVINDNIPTSTLKTIGLAFKDFTADDIAEIAATILKEDLGPLLQNLKFSVSSIKAKSYSAFSYISFWGKTVKKEGFKTVASELKTETYRLLGKSKKNARENLQETTILVPETKRRFQEFINNMARDFSLLQSDEEKGKYILKLAAYASVFMIAYQSGTGFPKASEQKSFIVRTLLPILMVNGSLTLINRVLEQVEKKIYHAPDAVIVTQEIRKFIKIVNTGIATGMTLQAFADGLAQTKLTPKGKVDSLIHSTVLALFSKDIPEAPEQ